MYSVVSFKFGARFCAMKTSVTAMLAERHLHQPPKHMAMLAMSAWFRPIAVFQRSHIGGKLLFHIIASIIMYNFDKIMDFIFEEFSGMYILINTNAKAYLKYLQTNKK